MKCEIRKRAKEILLPGKYRCFLINEKITKEEMKKLPIVRIYTADGKRIIEAYLKKIGKKYAYVFNGEGLYGIKIEKEAIIEETV